MTEFRIGIDGGGSKTHAILVDHNYHIIDQIVTGPANIKTNLNTAIKSVIEAIEYLIKKYGLNGNLDIGIGVAGFSDFDSRMVFNNTLKQTYPKVNITSDAHIACLAAHSGEDGSIIICGTGVVGYNLQSGIGTQIGGWGFPHGDIGGGAWIGLEFCRMLCNAIDKTLTFSPLLNAIYEKFNNDKNQYKSWLLSAKPQKYAEIAKFMPDFIAQNDPNAKSVLEIAVKAISNLISTLPQENITITGGLASFYYPYLKTSHKNLTISIKNNALGACYLTAHLP